MFYIQILNGCPYYLILMIYGYPLYNVQPTEGPSADNWWILMFTDSYRTSWKFSDVCVNWMKGKQWIRSNLLISNLTSVQIKLIKHNKSLITNKMNTCKISQCYYCPRDCIWNLCGRKVATGATLGAQVFAVFWE